MLAALGGFRISAANRARLSEFARRQIVEGGRTIVEGRRIDAWCLERVEELCSKPARFSEFGRRQRVEGPRVHVDAALMIIDAWYFGRIVWLLQQILA